MHRILLPLSLCALLSATAAAQAMVEYAAGAATGSAGAAGGKGISKGLDNIFGKLNQATQKAASTAPAAKAAQPAAANVGTPAAAGAATRSRKPLATLASTQPTALPSTPEAEVAPVPETAVIAAPPAPTVEDLATIELGVTRQDLLARLGRPAGSTMIPGDEGLQETYTYQVKGQLLGKVRLLNGTVVAVEPAAKIN